MKSNHDTDEVQKRCYRIKRKETRKKCREFFFASLLVLGFIVTIGYSATDIFKKNSSRLKRQTDNSDDYITWKTSLDVDCANWDEATDCTYGFYNRSIYGNDIKPLKEACYKAVKDAKLLANISEEHVEICAFEKDNFPGLWLAFYVLCVLWLFVAIAIICDDFFVPSLEAISEKLDLSEDVAGATFMAAGSSAPELFTALAGATNESDVGVGTIVGSAVFNLLVIVALSSALAGQVLVLDWRPLARDATFYAMSIVFMIVFTWDGHVEWFEAMVLVFLYLIYVLIMRFNPQLMNFLLKLETCCSKKNAIRESELTREHSVAGRRSSLVGTTFRHTRHGEIAGVVSGTPMNARRADSQMSRMTKSSEHDLESSQRRSTNGFMRQSSVSHGAIATDHSPAQASDSGIEDEQGSVKKEIIDITRETETPKEVDDADSSGEDEKCYLCPCIAACPGIGLLPPATPDKSSVIGGLKYFSSWLLFLMSFPFYVFYTFSIPTCSTPETRKYYLVSFTMSILWIVAISFGLLTVVEHSGCILNIGHFTMGLVVIAVGTSVPDALSSILVARDGFGDMAVSNAIGSNVFDINLGLGAPFLIFSLIRSKPVSLLKAEDWCIFNSLDLPIKLMPHVKFGFVLLLILGMTLAIFTHIKFRLEKKSGVILFFVYVLFLAYAFTQELVCNSFLC